MMSVKGLTWGTPEFTEIAKLGERIYEQMSANEDSEELDDE